MSTVLIDDQDPSITYTGTWVVGGTIHEHDGTVSSSVKVGDHFSVPFNGTGITVFGTFDATSTGVRTLYSIDGDQGTVVTSQASGNGLDDFQQPFWKSGTISDGQHTLVVTMRAINGAAGDGEGTIWFDYFQVTGSHPASTSASQGSSSTVPVSSSSSSSASPSPTSPASHTSSSHGGLIGGVIAAAVVVVLICIGLFLWRRRRQRDFADSTSVLPFGGGPPQPGYPYPTPAPMASLSNVPSSASKVGVLYGNNNTQPYGYGPIPQAPMHESSYGITTPGSTPGSAAYPYPVPMAMAYHHQPSASTSAAGTSSYAGSSSGEAVSSSNVTDMKRRQQEVVASYEQGVGINGGPSIAPPAPVQHVDSGIRELDVNGAPKPAEIPPVYTAQ
ncbi:hypothetical protein FB45DRAFT_931364 [Roridomyces roridus]|uniref:Uncharacterized protein n=1 Tax=Roridomyces roridus TaxID=1738132 RepID=A0AAD7FHZ9_9AGAR|nr:hypothetical protein FB45DRAFT_931364 [Roridomyces roridus]